MNSTVAKVLGSDAVIVRYDTMFVLTSALVLKLLH